MEATQDLLHCRKFIAELYMKNYFHQSSTSVMMVHLYGYHIPFQHRHGQLTALHSGVTATDADCVICGTDYIGLLKTEITSLDRDVFGDDDFHSADMTYQPLQ